jgi:hypothetical protein
MVVELWSLGIKNGGHYSGFRALLNQRSRDMGCHLMDDLSMDTQTKVEIKN